MRTRAAVGILVGLVLGPAVTCAQSAAPAPTGPGSGKPAAPAPAIVDGSTVRIEYILTDDAGRLLDSNAGKGPLVYTQGDQQIVPGLEHALSGMHAGEEKQVVVSAEDGYGPIDPEAQAEVPKALIPADALTVGTQLVAQSADGDRRVVRVKEIREGTVLIDLNHPLAGVTLHFAVKILGVEPPPAK